MKISHFDLLPTDRLLLFLGTVIVLVCGNLKVIQSQQADMVVTISEPIEQLASCLFNFSHITFGLDRHI